MFAGAILAGSPLTARRSLGRYNRSVIKSAIIVVLLILLCGGAFLSRPTRQGFEEYLRQQASGQADNPIARWIAGIRLDQYLSEVRFHDRLLWVEVEHGGKTQFIGVFSRFFRLHSGSGSETEGKPALREAETGKSRPFAGPGN